MNDRKAEVRITCVTQIVYLYRTIIGLCVERNERNGCI